MKNLVTILFIVFSFCAHAQSWSPVGSGVSGEVVCLYTDSTNNQLYAGGVFTLDADSSAWYIARWDGESWFSMGTEFNGGVMAITRYGDEIYAAGLFDTTMGFTHHHIARWNGTHWSEVGNGINGDVWSLCVYNGKLYAAGVFDTAGTVPAMNIACWDGTTWSAVDAGISNDVFALKVYHGELYAGGAFSAAGGLPAQNIAKWNDTLWQAVSTGTDGEVRCLEVFNDQLYMGGFFSQAGALHCNGIARWNGTAMDSVGLAPGPEANNVYGLKAYNGYLYVGGLFSAGWYGAFNIAKWNNSTWQTVGTYGFTGSAEWVNAIEAYKGFVYMGGNFTVADTVYADNIVRWDDGIVWPGDADHTAAVDHYDLLPIGLYYGQTGTARSAVSNVWQPYTVADWGTAQPDGADIKHADCNGDGVIDDADTVAVALNFDLVHAFPVLHPVVVSERSVADLYFTISGGPYAAGDWVNAGLYAGTTLVPVTDLYGLAFDLAYNNVVEPGTVSLNFSSSWLGTPGSNAIDLVRTDEVHDRVLGAMTRTDHNAASGNGKIAELTFQLKSSFAVTDSIWLNIQAYKANNATGDRIQFNTLPLTAGALTGITEQKPGDKLMVYPNPTLAKIFVRTRVSKEKIAVFDISGKQVMPFTQAMQNGVMMDVTALQPGIYFVKAEATSAIFVKE